MSTQSVNQFPDGGDSSIKVARVMVCWIEDHWKGLRIHMIIIVDRSHCCSSYYRWPLLLAVVVHDSFPEIHFSSATHAYNHIPPLLFITLFLLISHSFIIIFPSILLLMLTPPGGGRCCHVVIARGGGGHN